MAAYAQLGYGYPSARQLLVSGAQPTIPIITTPSSAHSPISIAQQTTAISRSPNSSGGGTTTMHSTHNESNLHNCGSLTPDANSQSSNTATSSIATGSTGGAANGSPFVGTTTTDGAAVAVSTTSPCCENGRLILADPITGQTVCSCQYDSARLAALSGYTAAAAAARTSMQPATAPTTANMSVYGAHYAGASEQSPYPGIGVGVDSATAFYPSLSNPYALKDSSSNSDISAWTATGLQPSTSYYSYDPTLAAYGYGASYDLASRRKNATRESTATLKAWLNEHKKNPYPTKGEKIMLAIITKMTLTQVSTWFANARRRLKKENKVTWEPKNRTDDDDDAVASEDEYVVDREKERVRAERLQTPNALSHQRNNGASIAMTATTTVTPPTTASTGIGTGVIVGGGAGNSTTEVGIVDQPTKDLYGQQSHQQQQQQQYSHAYYYNNNSQQHTTHYQQQQQFLQHQQQMPLTMLSQHIADSMLLHQQQQQYRLQQ